MWHHDLPRHHFLVLLLTSLYSSMMVMHMVDWWFCCLLCYLAWNKVRTLYSTGIQLKWPIRRKLPLQILEVNLQFTSNRGEFAKFIPIGGELKNSPPKFTPSWSEFTPIKRWFPNSTPNLFLRCKFTSNKNGTWIPPRNKSQSHDMAGSRNEQM